MSALAFDPWAALKCKVGDATPPNPPNSPNPGDVDRLSAHKLGELGALAGVASPECKTAIGPADNRTEGELWAAAWKRDVERLWPEWLLKAFRDGSTEHASPTDGHGATEPDEPLWPDPGTPERERLDRRHATLVAGLLDGYNRHRALCRGPRMVRFDAKAGMPSGALYIGRAMLQHGLPASKWANPFRIGRDGTRAEVIVKHRDWLLRQPGLMAALPELRGRDLVCWCAPEACHGDVLLQLANGIG